MRTLLCSFLLLATASTTAAAMDKPPEDIKAKFYIFDTTAIGAERLAPSVELYSGRDAVKFERLLSLKKSFLPALQATSDSRVFK